MPIDTKHPQWASSIYAWKKSRDSIGGEKIIKGNNTKYLDMPTGMMSLTTSPSQGGSGSESYNGVIRSDRLLDERQYDPSWHPNPAYCAYLRRAKFPDLAAFTVRGLLGLATKRDFDFDFPPSLAYLEDEFTSDGKSLQEFYKFALNEVLQTGRLVCVVDVDENNRFKVVPYVAESNINWRDDEFFVFEEEIISNEDPFLQDAECAYRVLFIDKESNTYFSSIQKEESVEFELPDKIPTYMGKTLDQLPVVVIGSTNLDSDVDQIPIEGITDCSIQIYRKSADLSNAQYMSCNPTLVGIGVGEEDKPTALGSTVVWLIGNVEAKVSYPQTDTSALSHVKDDINDLFEEAANYGARLLGSPKRGAESAESVRLQQTAGGATLESVIDTVSSAIVKLVTIMATWGKISGDVSFEGSKEFSDMSISAAERKELRESWMAGGISQDTYLWNMKRSGVLPPDRTIDDELDLIDMMKAGMELPDENDLQLVVDNTKEYEDEDEDEEDEEADEA